MTVIQVFGKPVSFSRRAFSIFVAALIITVLLGVTWEANEAPMDVKIVMVALSGALAAGSLASFVASLVRSDTRQPVVLA